MTWRDTLPLEPIRRERVSRFRGGQAEIKKIESGVIWSCCGRLKYGCSEHTSYDDSGKWLLGLGTDPYGDGSGEQAYRSAKVSHQNRAHLLFGSFSSRFFQRNTILLKFGKTGDEQDSS